MKWAKHAETATTVSFMSDESHHVTAIFTQLADAIFSVNRSARMRYQVCMFFETRRTMVDRHDINDIGDATISTFNICLN